MREIKFRAWDKERRIMWGVSSIDFDTEEITNGGDIFSFPDVELMQYTGLKDKNGVEVYEGDVVRGQQTFTTAPTTPSEVVAVVEYSERKTKFYLNDGSDSHDQFRSCLSLGGSIYQYEIIGNIYENPELLKESGASE